MGDEKVSGIVTADEQKVEGDPKAKLDRLKTGDSEIDKIFEGTGTPDSGVNPSNINIGPRLTQKQLQGGTKGGLAAAPMPVETKERNC